MLYNNVYIETVAFESPPEIVSSRDIEKQLDSVYTRLSLPPGRLELMTGIKERRLWERNTLPSQGAAKAGRKALEMSAISPQDIGALVMCSVSKDVLEPATATIVHKKLALSPHSLVFDISNACLGILTGIITVANMIETEQIKAGLLVASENSRSLLESTIKKMNDDKTLTRKTIKPYFASLTIGCGAVALLLTHKSVTKAKHKLTGGGYIARTEYSELCHGNSSSGTSLDSDDTLMMTDSEELMKKGVETALSAWKIFSEELNWRDKDIDCYCTHQVGKAHKKLLFETIDLNLSKDFSTLEYYGNMGSVSCPATLALAIKNNVIQKGQKVALLGIGSGINSTMIGIEW